MKNGFLIILTFLLLLPAFSPWLPHGAVHVLQDHQTKHHGADTHGHSHGEHEAVKKQSLEHYIQFDAVSYFSDFLHVDLQSPDQSVLKTPAFDTHDIDYAIVAVVSSMARYELSYVRSRAPPDNYGLRPDKTPVYLSTQRLRI
jgi:hypothetical protein